MFDELKMLWVGDWAVSPSPSRKPVYCSKLQKNWWYLHQNLCSPHCFISFHVQLNWLPSSEPPPLLSCKFRFIRAGQGEKPQALAVGISSNPEITTLILMAHIEIQISHYSFRGDTGNPSALHPCSHASPCPPQQWSCMMAKSFWYEQVQYQSVGWPKELMRQKIENILLCFYITKPRGMQGSSFLWCFSHFPLLFSPSLTPLSLHQFV